MPVCVHASAQRRGGSQRKNRLDQCAARGGSSVLEVAVSTREFIRGEASLTASLEGHVTRMGSVTTGQDRHVALVVSGLCLGPAHHWQMNIVQSLSFFLCLTLPPPVHPAVNGTWHKLGCKLWLLLDQQWSRWDFGCPHHLL